MTSRQPFLHRVYRLHCTKYEFSFKPTNYCVFLFQFLIVVVDSTDRERLAVTKAELYNMLNHEVRSRWKLYEAQQLSGICWMKCYVFSFARCVQSGPLKKKWKSRWEGKSSRLEIQVGGGNPVRGGQKFLPSVGGVFLSGITQCYSVKTNNCSSTWNW